MKLTVDERLEASACDFFWVPDGVHVVEEPNLIFTHSNYDDPLFNCVVYSRGDDDELHQLVSRVSERHRGRQCRWLVNNLNYSEALEKALEAHGYRPGDEHRAFVLRADSYERTPKDDFDVRRVIDEQTLRDLDHTRRLAFGHTGVISPAQFARDLEECKRPNARVARFVVYFDDKPVGSASLTRHDELDLGFLWAGGVVEDYRGRGAYTALLKARCDWARTQDIDLVGLYAKLDTSAPIVEAHGFQRRGWMRYWNRNG